MTDQAMGLAIHAEIEVVRAEEPGTDLRVDAQDEDGGEEE